MTYLAPTPTRPVPTYLFQQALTPSSVMSTPQLSWYSGSYVSTPEHERNLSWGSEPSIRHDQLPVLWSQSSSSIELPQSSDFYSHSGHMAATSNGCIPWEYSSPQQQQQDEQLHRLDSPEFYLKSSPHDSPVLMSQILSSAMPQPQQQSRSLSPSFLPAQSDIAPQQSRKKRSQTKRSTALSHSVVERRYREGINSKIELLHRVLGHADQHSNVLASGASSTSDDTNYESIFSFDDLTNLKSPPNAVKARKADVLSNAIDYVKRAEQEKLALIHEVEFWKRRVVSMEDDPRR